MARGTALHGMKTENILTVPTEMDTANTATETATSPGVTEIAGTESTGTEMCVSETGTGIARDMEDVAAVRGKTLNALLAMNIAEGSTAEETMSMVTVVADEEKTMNGGAAESIAKD